MKAKHYLLHIYDVRNSPHAMRTQKLNWSSFLLLQVGALAKKLHISGIAADAPKLSLPGKLVFPSVSDTSHFSMLGLGDIVSSHTSMIVFMEKRYDVQHILRPQRVKAYHCSILFVVLNLKCIGLGYFTVLNWNFFFLFSLIWYRFQQPNSMTCWHI